MLDLIGRLLGSLSAEEFASLPIGTVIRWDDAYDKPERCVKQVDGWHSDRYPYDEPYSDTPEGPSEFNVIEFIPDSNDNNQGTE